MINGFWDRWKDEPLYRTLDHVDGVLLSHAHVDHTGSVSFLRPDIPLYTTAYDGAHFQGNPR